MEDQAPYPIVPLIGARVWRSLLAKVWYSALLRLPQVERGLQSAAFIDSGQECPRSLHLQAGVESSCLRAERLQALNKKLSTLNTLYTILKHDVDGRADDPSSAAQGRRLEDQAPDPIAHQVKAGMIQLRRLCGMASLE